MAALDIPTLVDCGCRAVVWGDHSGVEIEYCALHDAADAMLAAIDRVLEAGGSPSTDLGELEDVRRLARGEYGE